MCYFLINRSCAAVNWKASPSYLCDCPKSYFNTPNWRQVFGLISAYIIHKYKFTKLQYFNMHSTLDKWICLVRFRRPFFPFFIIFLFFSSPPLSIRAKQREEEGGFSCLPFFLSLSLSLSLSVSFVVRRNKRRILILGVLAIGRPARSRDARRRKTGGPSRHTNNNNTWYLLVCRIFGPV